MWGWATGLAVPAARRHTHRREGCPRGTRAPGVTSGWHAGGEGGARRENGLVCNSVATVGACGWAVPATACRRVTAPAHGHRRPEPVLREQKLTVGTSDPARQRPLRAKVSGASVRQCGASRPKPCSGRLVSRAKTVPSSATYKWPVNVTTRGIDRSTRPIAAPARGRRAPRR